MECPFIVKICSSKTVWSMTSIFFAKQNGENCSNVKIVLFRMLNKNFVSFFLKKHKDSGIREFLFLNYKMDEVLWCPADTTLWNSGWNPAFCPTEYFNSHAMQCHSYSFPELIFSYMKLSLFKRRLIFAHFRVSYKPRPILSWDAEEPSSRLCCKSWIKKVLISAFLHSR